MSDPTYRIRTEHRPWEAAGVRWVARVDRLSDETYATSIYRVSESEALAAAATWIAAQNQQQPGQTVYVDDDGRPVEGHSVKAP